MHDLAIELHVSSPRIQSRQSAHEPVLPVSVYSSQPDEFTLLEAHRHVRKAGTAKCVNLQGRRRIRGDSRLRRKLPIERTSDEQFNNAILGKAASRVSPLSLAVAQHG